MNTELMFSSKTDMWSTPQDFYNTLNDEFKFSLDPCCTHENAKCEKHFTIIENGLNQDWGGIQYFATLHMVENLKNGLKNHMMSQEKKILEWLC